MDCLLIDDINLTLELVLYYLKENNASYLAARIAFTSKNNMSNFMKCGFSYISVCEELTHYSNIYFESLSTWNKRNKTITLFDSNNNVNYFINQEDLKQNQICIDVKPSFINFRKICVSYEGCNVNNDFIKLVNHIDNYDSIEIYIHSDINVIYLPKKCKILTLHLKDGAMIIMSPDVKFNYEKLIIIRSYVYKFTIMSFNLNMFPKLKILDISHYQAPFIKNIPITVKKLITCGFDYIDISKLTNLTELSVRGVSNQIINNIPSSVVNLTIEFCGDFKNLINMVNKNIKELTLINKSGCHFSIDGSILNNIEILTVDYIGIFNLPKTYNICESSSNTQFKVYRKIKS